MGSYSHRKAFRKSLKGVLEPLFSEVKDWRENKISPIKGEIVAAFYVESGQFEYDHGNNEDQFVLVVELWSSAPENPSDALDDAADLLLTALKEVHEIAGCTVLPGDYSYEYDPDSFVGLYEQRFIVTKEI